LLIESLLKGIQDIDVQAEVYKMFRTVLEETDPSKFNELLEMVSNKLKGDVKTKSILSYFENWATKRSHWGYAFRIGYAINTNMFVEAFYCVFKYTYLKGKQNKRLDNTFLHLVKYNRDKVFQRLIKMTKGKNTLKVDLIHKRHQTSTSMETEISNESENEWLVMSSDTKKKHKVIRLKKTRCAETFCKLTCIECDICCHQYKCSCTDFLMNSLTCEHIHYVHQNEKQLEVS